MSQEDSFEQDGSAGLTPQVDAQAGSGSGTAPDPDKEGVVDHDSPGGGGSGGSGAWQAHGGDAPSRGPEASDGMSEPTLVAAPPVTGPDGEEVDADVSDGGQSGQDSGSMA